MAMERDERRNADLMKEVKEIGGDLREMKGKGAGSSLFFNTLISAIAALAAVVAIFRH